MSDLTALVALSFLGMTAAFFILHVYHLANQLAADLVAGTVGDAPMPAWFRTRMLFNMWLPYQALALAIEVVFLIVFLEAADLVRDESVRMVPYLFAFLSAVSAVLALMTMTFGLSQYVRGLRQID